jgi:DNA-binding NtrC family response regulator
LERDSEILKLDFLFPYFITTDLPQPDPTYCLCLGRVVSEWEFGVKDQLEALVTQMIERGLLFEEAISEFEKKFILKVLERNQGNQTKAARAMGIHRNTLNKKLASYNHSRK